QLDKRERPEVRDFEPGGDASNRFVADLYSSPEKLIERQVVRGLDEVESLLVVVATVGEETRFLLEANAGDDLGRPRDRPTGGPEAIHERPFEDPRFNPQASGEHVRQRRLAGSDRADDCPGFAFAEDPGQVLEHALPARPDHRRAIQSEEDREIIGIVSSFCHVRLNSRAYALPQTTFPSRGLRMSRAAIAFVLLTA